MKVNYSEFYPGWYYSFGAFSYIRTVDRWTEVGEVIVAFPFLTRNTKCFRISESYSKCGVSLKEGGGHRKQLRTTRTKLIFI
jgi:hypothetical protein